VSKNSFELSWLLLAQVGCRHLFLLFNFFSSYLSCFLYLFDLFEFDFILILTSLFFFSFLWITIWNGVGFDMRQLDMMLE